VRIIGSIRWVRRPSSSTSRTAPAAAAASRFQAASRRFFCGCDLLVAR
jgi:hypothetical protein